MDSSGQFADDFVAFIECEACGWCENATVSYDPELIQPWLFVCADCGSENRPDLFDDDPDESRDD